MDEGSGNDDTGAELFQNDEEQALLRHSCERCGQDGGEDSEGTCHENDEEQTDS